MTLRRAMGGLAVGSAVCLTSVVAVLTLSGAAPAAPATSTTTPAFTQTETISRTDLTVTTSTAGKTVTTVVASNTVTLNVGQITNLQGRQEISVSWSGAHPTGGIVANENSANAQYEEYPMVLLQCRDTPAHTDQPTPETCWTQSWTERYRGSNASNAGGVYPPYRLDQYATTHGAIVGQPPAATLPTTSECVNRVATNLQTVRYWLPWLAASGKVYSGGTGGACGVPPQANNAITSALPSNETFGVTSLGGVGNAEFDVFTTAENTTLDCSDTVACSLVAIPIMGISCDAAVLPKVTRKATVAAETADLKYCEDKGAYQPGTGADTQDLNDGDDLTVSGALWWSPSNWRNRITVPLTFAPPANACSVTTSGNSVNAYGSTLLLQATDQWDPSFCTRAADKFSFEQVATPEPEARNLVATGNADAALTSYAQTGGYGKPVVNAPVAVTGFTISYAIDGADGEAITTLKLTPLLLAKLLTESYPDLYSTESDPALVGNPLNITHDPEFMALNPTVAPVLGSAESELISISSNSDVIEALTTYINDTPTARAWLNGTSSGEPSVCNANGVYQTGDTDPCPAMVVNPTYKGIQLPVDQWDLLSTYISTNFDKSVSACLAEAPEPLYSLVAAPLANLEDVSEAMQFQEANSTMTCSSFSTGTSGSMVSQGRQEAGHYFMLGITPLADDQRYNLQTAALPTTTGTFVAPTTTSLKAAASLLTPDTATGTWPIPYTTFQTPAGASAYPGTMVVYAAIPTSGLSATDAADYASFLQFAATTGQTPGSGVGQLPPGYLPLTEADGLGALAAYTEAAATDVAAQNGQVPPLTPAAARGSATATSASATSSSATSSPSPSSGSSSPPSPSSGSSSSESGGSSGQVSQNPSSLFSIPSLPTVAAAVNPPGTAPAHHASKPKPPSLIPLGPTVDAALWTQNLGASGLFVLALALALLGALCVPATYLRGRRRGKW